MNDQVSNINNNIMKILTQNLTIGQSLNISTQLTDVILMKQYSLNLSNSINIGQNGFDLPSFCQMMNQINCNNTILNIQVRKFINTIIRTITSPKYERSSTSMNDFFSKF